MNHCLGIHDKLEASLRDLSRTGDVQACKAARKSADNMLKELLKDLKPLVSFLQSSPLSASLYSKVCLCILFLRKEFTHHLDKDGLH